MPSNGSMDGSFRNYRLTAHAFSSPCGGFPSLRHNDIRDITADFLTEVSPSVAVKPVLQPLTGELYTAVQDSKLRR